MAVWKWEKSDKGLYQYGAYKIAHEKAGWTLLHNGGYVGNYDTLRQAKERAVARENALLARLAAQARAERLWTDPAIDWHWVEEYQDYRTPANTSEPGYTVRLTVKREGTRWRWEVRSTAFGTLHHAGLADDLEEAKRCAEMMSKDPSTKGPDIGE